MEDNKTRFLVASTKAGALSAVIAPLLWPAVVYFMKGELPALGDFINAILPIVLFALILGVSVAIIIGVPSLLALEHLQLNKPPIVSVVGMIYGAVLVLMFGPGHTRAPISESWPLYLFFGILGAVIGFVASHLSRTNTAPQPTQ